MIKHEETRDQELPPQTETQSAPEQADISEESMLRPAGDSPPQTETDAGARDLGQNSLRQPRASKPSRSGAAAVRRRQAPRSIVTIDERPSVETDADRLRLLPFRFVRAAAAGGWPPARRGLW